MVADLFKGFLIGICASVPIGPIAILVIQKTISKGFKAGLTTGMGASIVDTLFAVVAIFALGFAQDFMDAHQELILIIGGVIVSFLGWGMSTADPFRRLRNDEDNGLSVTDFLRALMMGITNPGAIIVTFALFTFFGIDSAGSSPWHLAMIILSVFVGTVCWWVCLTLILNHFRKKFKLKTILWINRCTGAIVMIIGLALFCQGLWRVIVMGLPPLR